MNPKERSAIGQLFEVLSRVAPLEETYRAALMSLQALSGAYIGHIVVVPKVLGTTPVELFCGDYATDLARQHPHFIWKHPAWPLLGKVRTMAYDQTALVGERAFQNSEYYVDLCRRVELKRTYAVHLNGCDNILHWGVGLNYPRSQKRLSMQPLRVLESLAPHLGRGLDNLEFWRLWKQSAAELTSQFETMPGAYAIVSRGRIVSATSEMSVLLGMDRSPASRNQYYADFLRLCSKLESAAMVLPFQSRDGRPFALNGVRLPSNDDSTAWLVRLWPVSPRSRDEDRAAALANGLSAREADVMSLLVRGMGNKQIARELGVANDTVRSLLRRIFAKLNVSGRVAAVNAVREKR